MDSHPALRYCLSAVVPLPISGLPFFDKGTPGAPGAAKPGVPVSFAMPSAEVMKELKTTGLQIGSSAFGGPPRHAEGVRHLGAAGALP